MFLREYEISAASFVQDIVKRDYRTAAVFERHGIEYCCGARWPLATVCEMKGIDLAGLLQELDTATRDIKVYNQLPYEDWDIDFLADYIIRVHHYYCRHQMPRIREQLQAFTREHLKKYPQLAELEKTFRELYDELMPHLDQEEEIIFPYIRQIAHAFESSESYASLLVRTLRKPVEQVMRREHVTLVNLIRKLRAITDNYTPPANACTSHRVTFNLLRELDNDMMQHKYLENEVLFPRAIRMESILLSKQD
jgi:regulator of cell morphogenesis and NO signaling